MRLIDIDALHLVCSHYNAEAQRIIGEINKAPIIDTVPVIRCKDCKYYADDQCDRYADETLGYVHSTQADGYCWVAERKK